MTHGFPVAPPSGRKRRPQDPLQDPPEVPLLVRRFIQEAGHLTQSLGLGRVPGQIYAYLYFSDTPRTLGDMQRALGISKGSASTIVRMLEQWEAVRKVWVRGDRKDYYEASDWLGRIVRRALVYTVGQRLSAYATLLDEVERSPDFPSGDGPKARFLRSRIARLQVFQRRLQNLWSNPLLQALLR